MNLLNLIPGTDFIYTWIRVAIPTVFAPLGAVIYAKAGVIDLGLGGIMLIFALTGVLGSAFGGNLVWGVAAGMPTAVAMSTVFAYSHLALKANSVLCGTAVNTIASGPTVFVPQLAAGEEGNSFSLKSFAFPNLDIPVIKDIPMVGSILSGHNSLIYVTLVMVAVIQFFLYKTPTGLRMRTVGENPDAASSVGQNVVRIQLLAIVLCGLMTGFGGMYLSMGYLNMFVGDMTTGRGFISLAVCSVRQATPMGALLLFMIFVFFGGPLNILQVLKIPSEFIQMLPYLVTIAGLTIYSIQRSATASRKIKKLEEV